MEGLVISTRSFVTNKKFMENNHIKVNAINNSRINNSYWRKISLPIYMLDLFSEAGVDNVKTIIQQMYPTSNYPDIFNEFIKRVSQFIVEEDETQFNIQDNYEYALFVKYLFCYLVQNKGFKERFSRCFSDYSPNADFSETQKYTLQDLIEDHNSLFDCYECLLDKDKYPFSPSPTLWDSTQSDSPSAEDSLSSEFFALTPISPDYKCYVIRSFKRRLSAKLGEEYFKSLKNLFGEDADYLIHDYDYGKRLLQSSYSPSKRLLLFKHNKGDVYEILNNRSFSLLYLYVKFGYPLKAKVQNFIVMIENRLIQDTPWLLAYYNRMNIYCAYVKSESKKLSEEESEIIALSINNLEECLKNEVSDSSDLYEMMYNLTMLDDYVLRKTGNQEQ